MSTARILILDDDRLTRQLLARSLERDGFEVIQSQDGHEAFRMIQEVRPNLLVSDYEMPGLNGAEMCALVRRSEIADIAELPIILLTAHTGEEHEVECLQAGANDFVSKPVNAAILKARIDTHLRLHSLRTQLQQQNAELELWRHTHELDLEAAQITQQAILPLRPPRIPGWDFAAHFQPKIQVGGDMYDWIRLEDGAWLFWIADATGHGASAALLTTLTKLVFRHGADGRTSPSDVMSAVNDEFYGILRGKSFMTAACLVIRPEQGTLAFSGAGHPPLLLVRKDGTVDSLISQGPPVGILPQQECSETQGELGPGETALLYTDGLYSGTNSSGVRLTPNDLPELFPNDSVSAEDFLNETVNQVTRLANGAPLPDDLAAVALRRLRKGR